MTAPSDSARAALPPDALVLAFDGASPVASAAVARAGILLAERAQAEARSSGILLRLIEAAVGAAGARIADLAALVALRGPGSFTGARVTLATAAGLHLGGVPRATAVSTLEALALAAPATMRRPLAAVDALRGDWFLQGYETGPAGPMPCAEPVLTPLESPLPAAADGVVGFGLAPFARRWPALARCEPAALAGPVAIASSRGRWVWDEGLLAQPLYLRPPATRTPA